ncbi:TetR/AcrR family transcriptional regulator [Streptomyces sp. NPDC057950]|uniref:TetR/AcrR family transcriptional regulator n=1 Tax=Streptomyces sp. NPDC057950 TaxID=3346288 RepID=UPI0036E0ED8C
MARPRSFDEQAVVGAAVLQFRKTGYAGTTMDDLSDATGLGRGSLYASFGDKHVLFIRALLEYVREALAGTERALVGPDETAIDRLRGFLASGARFVVDDKDQLGCMAGKFSHELGARDEEARKVIHEVFTKQHQLLADCVQAAQRHGDLDPGADPLVVGCTILSINRGFDVMAKAGIDPALLEAAADQAFHGLPLTFAHR